MQQVQATTISEDHEHGWDEWFDEEPAEPGEPRAPGIGRYILLGLAVEVVVLVIALLGS